MTTNKRNIKFKKRKPLVKKKNTWTIFKWILFLLISFLIIGLIWSIVLYKKYIEPLPPVESLKDIELAESSIIYDKDWKELYKIFKEKRTYIDYSAISKNMVNAIVAWEDKRFWENPWFDLSWIFRAIIYKIIWKSDKIQWTSTLSQQLMKITYLSNERKIERKVKEIYLSYKLNKVFSKEKIIELYLNKIEYWSNAFGIEQAAKTFFWKSASDLNILESSILASLPKWPTYYSPYSHYDRLMWYPYIYKHWENNEEYKTKILVKKDYLLNKNLVDSLKTTIANFKFKDLNWKLLICWLDKNNFKKNIRIDSDWCVIKEYSDLLTLLNSIKIKKGDSYIEYQTWRKDFILWRMFEDKYITSEEYKKALLDSFIYTFKVSKDKIKNPYFVMYVREFLENKYWKDVVEKGWLKIYTTLDREAQDKAEKIVKKYVDINKNKYWAKNWALISIDNKTWGIIAMVWWTDYFDTENWWNNNMIISRLQPWSTFKPFTYALAIQNNPIWTKTPVYDVKTTFPWNYTPHNFDWKFKWKMNISTALDNSRNIPAIKMFFMAWWEEKILEFMKKLWVKTLQDFKNEYFKKYKREYQYWAPMSLWTWLMTPLELAWAYSTFANMWIYRTPNPIIKIVDSKWNIITDIDRYKNTIKEKIAISPALAYIMNSILSDTNSRPSFWNKYLTINWRKVAAKTWTSTKQYKKNWKEVIAPRNLWTAWYTPQYTTVVWAWNTNWKELYLNWNWLEWAWPMWKEFMEYIHTWKKVENWEKPKEVKDVTISEISWLLPTKNLPSNFYVKSLFLNPPTKYDNSLKQIEVDTLCNWKVTSETPPSAIKTWYLLYFHSLNPENSAWEKPVQALALTLREKYIWKGNVITNYKDEPCKRNWQSSAIIKTNIANWQTLSIWNNYIEVAYKSSRPIIKIQLFLWNNLLTETPIQKKSQWWKGMSINIPEHFLNTSWKLIIKIIDAEYYSNSLVININVWWKDKEAPIINLSTEKNIVVNKWEKVQIIWKVTDSSSIKSVNFYINWKPLKLWYKKRNFNFPINTKNLNPWIYIIKVEAYDYNFNSSYKEIKLEIKENKISTWIIE